MKALRSRSCRNSAEWVMEVALFIVAFATTAFALAPLV
jgi:hypothetical protein